MSDIFLIIFYQGIGMKKVTGFIKNLTWVESLIDKCCDFVSQSSSKRICLSYFDDSTRKQLNHENNKIVCANQMVQMTKVTQNSSLDSNS